ncbi:hypothetical protein [Aureimonas leprariae]|uniref:Uncharacterized protein n=1 Tax=Plantimonas leprariae TaxID=2615207 RepID=A0A7V7PSH1_9HYPH|nr:hypothetical protein [Aureimonas leprariae]KAB0682012.1 hypothetical protein F6X38_04185 [Aureimonas leprariae]
MTCRFAQGPGYFRIALPGFDAKTDGIERMAFHEAMRTMKAYLTGLVVVQAGTNQAAIVTPPAAGLYLAVAYIPQPQGGQGIAGCSIYTLDGNSFRIDIAPTSVAQTVRYVLFTEKA